MAAAKRQGAHCYAQSKRHLQDAMSANSAPHHNFEFDTNTLRVGRTMADIFGYITPGELNSTHDPEEVLASAATLADLLLIKRYDPNSTDSWERAKVYPLNQQSTVVNQKTSASVIVTACRLEQ